MKRLAEEREKRNQDSDKDSVLLRNVERLPSSRRLHLGGSLFFLGSLYTKFIMNFYWWHLYICFLIRMELAGYFIGD